jgi:acyl carrier protein
VAAAVVAAREERPGEHRLVAYTVAAGGEAVNAAELKAHLRRRLPDYMIPAVFVTLDALPLTPNGKTDRRALPAPEGAATGLEAQYVAAGTPLEEKLAAIWASVLGVERVGVNDSFFDLGGHSLLLARVQSRIRSEVEREVGMVDLFRFPTVRSLAARLTDDGAENRAARGRDRGEARRAARDRRERRGVGAEG